MRGRWEAARCLASDRGGSARASRRWPAPGEERAAIGVRSIRHRCPRGPDVPLRERSRLSSTPTTPGAVTQRVLACAHRSPRASLTRPPWSHSARARSGSPRSRWVRASMNQIDTAMTSRWWTVRSRVSARWSCARAVCGSPATGDAAPSTPPVIRWIVDHAILDGAAHDPSCPTRRWNRSGSGGVRCRSWSRRSSVPRCPFDLSNDRRSFRVVGFLLVQRSLLRRRRAVPARRPPAARS